MQFCYVGGALNPNLMVLMGTVLCAEETPMERNVTCEFVFVDAGSQRWDWQLNWCRRMWIENRCSMHNSSLSVELVHRCVSHGFAYIPFGLCSTSPLPSPHQQDQNLNMITGEKLDDD
jgi:hypothetical protein